MAGENNVNGNYGVQPPYGHSETYPVTTGTPSAPDANPSEHTSGTVDTEEKPPTKEEIGWFFVEQYYKTLCNEPGKLYLYYNKRSQFVSGDEAEKVQVAVGQKAISERIKQLDIQDCKVRVLNVDSQESLKNILVQVIGEMSNKAEPHRKFVQTFVLAEQPSGYYVLNDVFRYIVLDEEEFENGEQEPAATLTSTTLEPKADESSAFAEEQVEKVDQKLGEAAQEPAESVSTADDTNGNAAPTIPHIHADAEEADPQTSVEAVEAAVDQERLLSEKPRDPDPTPIASPPKSNNVVPAEPISEAPKPAAPKTWANLVAANRVATPASSSTSAATATPSNPAKTKAPSTKESATPTSTGEEPPAKAQPNGNSNGNGNGNAGWQMAGAGNEKRQNRQHSQSVSGNGSEAVSAYVKNVTEKVDASILKEKLSQHGKLKYFDVSRPKNCAFVDFENVAGYQAAVAANPYLIGGEQVLVEERRPRGNAYGGNFGNRGGMRGGRGNDNRANNSGRGNFGKDGGRGGYNNRPRGNPMAARGRTGQPQPA